MDTIARTVDTTERPLRRLNMKDTMKKIIDTTIDTETKIDTIERTIHILESIIYRMERTIDIKKRTPDTKRKINKLNRHNYRNKL